jgi:hypothetical protein
MPTRRLDGWVQYQTQAEGEACRDWMDTWVADHQDDIIADATNHHTLTVIDPPHEEGCVRMLTVLYHMHDADAFADEVKAAIWYGGVGNADCDSSFQTTS